MFMDFLWKLFQTLVFFVEAIRQHCCIQDWQDKGKARKATAAKILR